VIITVIYFFAVFNVSFITPLAGVLNYVLRFFTFIA